MNLRRGRPSIFNGFPHFNLSASPEARKGTTRCSHYHFQRFMFHFDSIRVPGTPHGATPSTQLPVFVTMLLCRCSRRCHQYFYTLTPSPLLSTRPEPIRRFTINQCTYHQSLAIRIYTTSMTAVTVPIYSFKDSPRPVNSLGLSALAHL
jgi:hypothetical protein